MSNGLRGPDTRRVDSPSTRRPPSSRSPLSISASSRAAPRSPSGSPWRPSPSCCSRRPDRRAHRRARARAVGRSALDRARGGRRAALLRRLIALFWMVGRRASPRLDLRAGVEITLGGAAATRLLPTAGVGGAALTLWAINKTGMGTEALGPRAADLPVAAVRRLPARHRGLRRGDRARPRRQRRPRRRRGGAALAAGWRSAWRSRSRRVTARPARARPDRARRGAARLRGARRARLPPRRRCAPARRAGLVGVRRRRAVGDLQRARRAAGARRARLRILRRSGR